MAAAGGEGAPDIQELIDALLHGDPGQQQEEDPLAFPSDKSSHGAKGQQPDEPDVDEEGYITGRAAEFATKKDLTDWNRNHSLKTGDPGIGAWGDNTAGVTPGVAIPRNWLAAKYGHEDNAKGKTVTIIAPNGKTATVPILDKGPAGRRRANDAAVEVNEAAKELLGAGDSKGWRYKMN
jgi:hypothetical protein